MRTFALILMLSITGAAQAAPVSSFSDIQYWVGSGSNSAALVIDWEGENAQSTSYAWGYRWDGEATGEDMILAVIAADPRLFAKAQVFGGGLGMALYALGYDNGDGVFQLNDNTTFDANGLAIVAPADAAFSLDAADLYEEGWFTGFWHYATATGNPYGAGSWASFGSGAGSRTLNDGAWDSWAFTPNFDFNSFASNPQAAVPVPEPTTFALLLLAAPVALFAVRRRRAAAVAVAFITLGAAGTAHAGSFASEVISYTPGTPVGVGNPAPFQTDGSQALGSPSHDTLFGSQVGVFYPAFGANELVIIGAGGELTVKFDAPVQNHPNNPYGIDLLIFGNAAFTRNPSTGAATGFSVEPGDIAVSQDGLIWHTIPDVFADTLYPTLGYTDTAYNGTGNYGGTILTDFTLPVDPTFDPLGLTEAEINAGYNGSGGGTGVDLDSIGLDWILYVRVSQPTDSQWSTEIDAFAAVTPIPVPEPSTLFLAAVAACGMLLRVRSRR